MTNSSNDDDYYTEDGLKLALKPSSLEEILRERYKYISADYQYYILTIFVIGVDRVSRARYSKY
jgi:hypothetical protein